MLAFSLLCFLHISRDEVLYAVGSDQLHSILDTKLTAGHSQPCSLAQESDI